MTSTSRHTTRKDIQMKTVSALFLVLSLTGCAACREHPVLCVGTAIVVGYEASRTLEERHYPAPRHGGPVRPRE